MQFVHAAATAVIDAQDAYNRDVKIKKVLAGMAFLPDTWEKEVRVLSGGERTRLQLAKLLVQNPDLLILDEPTNHLDFETLEWLESYLNGYSGAILAVSHADAIHPGQKIVVNIGGHRYRRNGLNRAHHIVQIVLF